MLGKPIENVGVIVVHGIGEQGRFEHLESETRKIVDAIFFNYGHRRRDVTVTLSTGTADEFHETQSSWVSGSEAPFHALIHFKRKIVNIAFYEVWWADVNETLTRRHERQSMPANVGGIASVWGTSRFYSECPLSPLL